MDGDGRAGVVWHTQGAGKSYSMVFYVTKLRRDPRFENPTIVCVTDRNDLDNQLLGDLRRARPHLAPPSTQADSISKGARQPARAARRARRRDRLHDDPEVRPRQGRGRDAGALASARNVIVIADEAHRSPVRQLRRRTCMRRCRTRPASASPARRSRRPTSSTRLDLRRLHLRLPDGPGRRRTARRSRSTTRVAPGPGRRRPTSELRRGRGGARRRGGRGRRPSSSTELGRSSRRSSARPTASTRSPTTSPTTSPTAARRCAGKAMVVGLQPRDLPPS